MNNNAELIPHTTLLQLVNAWNTGIEEVRLAYALLTQCEKRFTEIFHDTYRFDLSAHHFDSSRFSKPEEAIKTMQRDVWRLLIDRMEVRKLLSVKRAKELDSALELGQMADGTPLPDITEEHIFNMMQSFMSNVNDFMEQAVREVFDFLRPKRSQYKTNTEFEIGDRVILSWIVEGKYGGGGYRINYNRQAEIRALDNVFHLLDGKGPVGTHYGPLHDAIENTASGIGETEYFGFKCYNNRNLHLHFKRMDLVKQLNEIAGGFNLRQAQAA